MNESRRTFRDLELDTDALGLLLDAHRDEFIKGCTEMGMPNHDAQDCLDDFEREALDERGLATSSTPEWRSGFGGAAWLCGLGLHPAPSGTETTCPACGKEIVR